MSETLYVKAETSVMLLSVVAGTVKRHVHDEAEQRAVLALIEEGIDLLQSKARTLPEL